MMPTRDMSRIAAESLQTRGHETRVRATPERAQSYCSCGWFGPTRSWWRSRTSSDIWQHAYEVMRDEYDFR